MIRSGEHAKLSRWCTVQRRAFKKGKLSPQRIARLEAIGFMWDPIENVWNQRFQELAAYKNRFGDCNASLKWNENPELGVWCSHQRQAFKQGKLSPERITRLEELGFPWVRFDSAWEKMFGPLIDYKKRFGNCNVPQGWNEDQKLGRWVSTQRRLRKKGQLSPERIARLSELGFVWDRLDGAWERAWVKRYQELVAYKNRFGDCNVPKKWCENTTLGLWCRTQRAEYKKGKLTPERINRLEKIGFRWQLH